MFSEILGVFGSHCWNENDTRKVTKMYFEFLYLMDNGRVYVFIINFWWYPKCPTFGPSHNKAHLQLRASEHLQAHWIWVPVGPCLYIDPDCYGSASSPDEIINMLKLKCMHWNSNFIPSISLIISVIKWVDRVVYWKIGISRCIENDIDIWFFPIKYIESSLLLGQLWVLCK